MPKELSICTILFKIILIICVGINCQQQQQQQPQLQQQQPRLTTELDNFRDSFVLLRRVVFGMTSNNMNNLFMDNIKNGKIQERIPETVAFPCNLNNSRSSNRPDSVDFIRPGDIDVIAAIGDSLSAGNGGLSNGITHILNEHRGISFSGGGKGHWRKFLTLPNILKVFNPNLYGYSISDGLTLDKDSRLNIAEPMIMSRDMTYQARVLAKRMKNDININMSKDWKLLTIFVGNNDVCSDMCHYPRMQDFVDNHSNDLILTLRYLRDNIPRLIVNIVPVPNMIALYHMKGSPPQCYFVHHIGCHCIFSSNVGPNKLEQFSNLIKQWQQREFEICNMDEFNTKEFTAIFQPFMANITLPSRDDGNTDLRYFASDCFHFSQRGHALAANSLWNNMMQPNGKKQQDLLTEFPRFECPTEERPYIATKANSLE